VAIKIRKNKPTEPDTISSPKSADRKLKLGKKFKVLA
jgi:hypothetical protein